MELDYQWPNDTKYANDIEKWRKHNNDDRVCMFLTGLDQNLNHVNNWVLATSSLPSLEEATTMSQSIEYPLWILRDTLRP